MADTILYVDPAMNDDSGDGASPQTAKKTIQAAINICSSTGSDMCYINLLPGSYNDTTQGTAWTLRFDNDLAFGDAKNITIQSSDGTERTITMTASSYAIDIEAANCTIVLKDMNFGNCTKTYLLTVDDESTGTNITLDNIICTSVNGGDAVLAFSDVGAKTTLGTVKIYNCTLQSNVANKFTITIGHDLAGLDIRNSVIEQLAGDSMSYAVRFSTVGTPPAIGWVNISNSTFKGASPFSIKDYTPRLTIDSSNFYATRSGGNPDPAIFIGYEYAEKTAWVGDGSTEYAEGDVRANDGWMYECLVTHTDAADKEPGLGEEWEKYWKVWESIVATVTNCNFEILEGSAHAVAAMYGSDVKFVGCSASGGNIVQFSFKANKAVVQNCYAVGITPMSLYSRFGGTVSNCYLRGTAGTNTVLGLNKQSGVDSVHYPDRRVDHNILVSEVSGVGGIQCNSNTPQHYSDYNIYYNTAGNVLANLGSGAAQTSLDEIKAFYANSPYPANDLNSLNTNPGEKTGMLIDGIWYGIPGDSADDILESNVREGVTYGTDKTGTLDLPAEEDVRAGVTFDNGTKTGSSSPAIDDNGNVIVSPESILTIRNGLAVAGEAASAISSAGLATAANQATIISNQTTINSNIGDVPAAVKTVIEAEGSKLDLINGRLPQSPAISGEAVTAAAAVISAVQADFSAVQKQSLNAATPAVTVSDKTGFKLASDGFNSVAPTEPTGDPAGWSFATKLIWLVYRFFGQHKKNDTTKKIEVYNPAGTKISEQAYTITGNNEEVAKAGQAT
jgi:hypothetical protein